MKASCVICGCPFVVPNPKRVPRTCSRLCRARLARQGNPNWSKTGPTPKPRVIAACEWCGSPVKWAQRPSRQGKFCSRVCSGRAKSKGGVTLKDGRWRVRLRDGGWQLYSRCVMEAHLGRDLTYNEVVHHVNGDPTADGLENLAVMSRGEHTAMHAREYWSILRSQNRV
jgi:hypothetical protein